MQCSCSKLKNFRKCRALSFLGRCIRVLPGAVGAAAVFRPMEESVEKVSASLKEAGYRSARQYFARTRREHVLQMKNEVPPEVLLKMRDAIRSIERRDRWPCAQGCIP